MKKVRDLLAGWDEGVNLNALFTRIICAIDREQVLRTKRRILVARISSWLSAVSLVVVFVNTVSQFQTSGFFNYFSLLFSDGGTVLSFWREFALSLAESLPWLGLSLIFATLFVFLVSLRFTAKNLQKIGWSANLA